MRLAAGNTEAIRAAKGQRMLRAWKRNKEKARERQLLRESVKALLASEGLSLRGVAESEVS